MLLFQWLRSPSFEGERIAAIEAIQKERGTRVITLIHREEAVSLFEIPISKYINIDDAEAISQVTSLVSELLQECMSEKDAQEITALITTGQFTHDFPITVERAKSVGFCISTDLPKSIYNLMDFYPQTGAGRPSVNYVPMQQSP
jgi:ClpP class serine protease